MHFTTVLSFALATLASAQTFDVGYPSIWSMSDADLNAITLSMATSCDEHICTFHETFELMQGASAMERISPPPAQLPGKLVHSITDVHQVTGTVQASGIKNVAYYEKTVTFPAGLLTSPLGVYVCVSVFATTATQQSETKRTCLQGPNARAAHQASAGYKACLRRCNAAAVKECQDERCRGSRDPNCKANLLAQCSTPGFIKAWLPAECRGQC